MTREDYPRNSWLFADFDTIANIAKIVDHKIEAELGYVPSIRLESFKRNYNRFGCEITFEDSDNNCFYTVYAIARYKMVLKIESDPAKLIELGDLTDYNADGTPKK